MAPGQQETRRWSNNSNGRGHSASSILSEFIPVAVESPFEGQLVQELLKSDGCDIEKATSQYRLIKKPFLKKGTRGWWMRQRDAKQKLIKHTLVSKGEENKIGNESMNFHSKKSGTSPVATPPKQTYTTCTPSSTSSSIERKQYSQEVNNLNMQEESIYKIGQEVVEWKPGSIGPSVSVDMMDWDILRHSYAANQEREADEMADFEAIEQDLLAKKNKEKQHLSSAQPSMLLKSVSNGNQAEHSFSSFVSEHHDQGLSRWQFDDPDFLDDSLNGKENSVLVFDDHIDLSKDNWTVKEHDDTRQPCFQFGYENNYGDLLSDLSAVSFDDSVPWDNSLSLQPRQIPTHYQQRNAGIDKLNLHNNGFINDDIFDEGDTATNDAGHDRKQVNVDSANLPSSTSPPKQDLTMLKQQFRGKQTSSGVVKGKTRDTGPKSGARTRTEQKSVAENRKAAQRCTQTGVGSGLELPSIIEEKLYELEEEVKFYKAETLQVRKRKDYYDQEIKKLHLDRDKFAQYQKEQVLLIEKEWNQERIKMKKSEKVQERQWKAHLNATISHQERKDRGEVEMLKAQIVKMQLDENARVGKLKVDNENLRQLIMELENKNQELTDTIKFFEKDRLVQCEKYNRLVKGRQDANRSIFKFESSTSKFDESGKLRTTYDGYLSKKTADELSQRWGSSQDPSRDRENNNSTLAVDQDNICAKSDEADLYNLKRYSLDGKVYSLSREPKQCSHRNGFQSTNNDDDSIQLVQTASTGNSATSYEGSILVGNDQVLQNTGNSPCSGNELDAALSTTRSEHKMMSREIKHPGGKTELLFSDGSRKITFTDGNEKHIDASGRVIIRFTNGDLKEVSPDTGISVYYYFEARTKLTTYPDSRKVYEFPNQQIETTLPDGTTEIQFADGIKKTIRPNGDEFSAFPDGTTMLEQPDGLREVTLPNKRKISYFPDGQMMACSSPGGC
ncbi:putative T-complex protein 10 family [Plasmopara halstedii]